jgi:hypothetical protein
VRPVGASSNTFVSMPSNDPYTTRRLKASQ